MVAFLMETVTVCAVTVNFAHLSVPAPVASPKDFSQPLVSRVHSHV